MNALRSTQPQAALDHGEAYRRCMQELLEPEPDYQAAQLYATLSLEETVGDVATQLADLTKALIAASRRR
jgi:hypothetical protein